MIIKGIPEYKFDGVGGLLLLKDGVSRITISKDGESLSKDPIKEKEKE